MKKGISIKWHCILSVLIVISMIIYDLNSTKGTYFLFGVIICYFAFMIRGKVMIKTDMKFAWAMFILFFALILYILRISAFSKEVVTPFVLALCLLLGFKTEYSKTFLRLIKLTGVFETTGILLQFFFPQLYISVMRILVGEEVCVDILNNQNVGYLTGFTSQVGRTSYFFIAYIGVIVFEIIYKNRKQNITGVKITGRNMLSLLIGITALIMTGKRAHFVFGSLAIAITVFIFSKSKLRILKATLIVLSLLIIAILTFKYWSNIPTLSRIYDWICSLRNSDDLFILTNGRSNIYDYAIDLWKNNKLFGIGWGNFSRSMALDSGFYGWNVHNNYLQILVENGIIGAFIYYGLSFMVILKTAHISVYFRNKKELPDPYLAFAIYYAVFFALYSITGTPLYEYSYLVTFIISIITIQSYSSICEAYLYKKRFHYLNRRYSGGLLR